MYDMRNRYILPFLFGSSTIACRDIMLSICNKSNGSVHWTEDTVWRGEHDIYNYVLETFEAGGGTRQTNTGIILKYENDGGCIKHLIYKQKDDDQECPFDIVSAGMILFINGVGFFWYEIGSVGLDRSMSFDALIDFQCRFKELNYKKNMKVFYDAKSDSDFLMGDWIARLLKPVIPVVRFFAPRRNAIYDESDYDSPIYVPDKAILYNYVAYEESVYPDAAELAYYLTKGYKKSYDMPPDIEKRMLHPFDNVICYAGNEGVGYYARVEDKNRDFFERVMGYRFMNDYFIMYILALNVYYSLILFADRIDDELPADALAYMPRDMYGEEDIFAYDKHSLYELERKVTRLVTEFNVFVSKNVRVSVSNIEHHNDFYEYVVSVLRINENIENTKRGLDALQDVLSDMVKREMVFSNNEDLLNWRKTEEYSELRKENVYLQEAMYKDELTGLLNQKAYLKYSQQIYDEAKENGKILFICSVDMNGLKHINDECGGHEEGDRALRGIATLLRKSALEGDYLFRKGGDEFVVLGIRDTADIEAKRFSNAMEEAMIAINKDSGLQYRIEASYGPLLVDMNTCDESLDSLFKRSDDMMYEMKMARDKFRR